MDEKLRFLLNRLSALEPLGIAYSGGLDSRFLALCAARADARFTLFHFSGPHVGKEETKRAAAWAEHHGYPLKIVPMNVPDIPGARENGRERCYYCKSALFSTLRDLAAGLTPCDGTNAEDLRSPRPGVKALRELGIASPLAEAGFEKREIRETARLLGLERPDQPARPCLMTRFAYGTRPGKAELILVDALEEEAGRALRAFFPNAPEAPDFRIRVDASRRAELHVAAPLSPEQATALQDALNARLAEETANARAGNRAFETLAARCETMPVRESDNVSGYHDRNRSVNAPGTA